MHKYIRYQMVASLLIMLLSLSGCATVDQLNMKYPGYKVIDKNVTSITKKIPIRITSCVTPQGNVLCERRYGAMTECSFRCKTPLNKWVERPEGYGGYENKTNNDYYLIIKSPAGKVDRIGVSKSQYDGFNVEQVIGSGK